MYAPRGLGQAAQVISTGASLATPVAAPAISSAVGASSVLGGLAVPVIGAALAGVTLLVTKLIQNSGCGITCVETSQWANQAEPLLKQNAQAYFALPAPRSQSAQAAALTNFDQIWATLEQQCSQPGTGNAGKRCISDRQSGACTWKQTGTSPWPGGPPLGACWNWFNAYRDPIANDPNVVPDSQAALATASSVLGGLPVWALLGGAALIAWWAIS
jgi:hypothetical protein